MLKFGIDDVDSVIENGVAHAEEGDHMVLGRCSEKVNALFRSRCLEIGYRSAPGFLDTFKWLKQEKKTSIF